MENNKVIAKFNRAKVSSQKARLVANHIRGMKVQDAQSFLEFSDLKSAGFIKGVVDSAVANANSKGLDTNELTLTEVRIDEGVSIKGRGLYGSRGKFKPLKRRSSNIFVALGLKNSETKLEGMNNE